MFSTNAKILHIFLSLTLSIGLPSLGQASDGHFSGKSITKGGSKPFCKGSTPLTATVTGTKIMLELPLNAGGTAKIKGTIDKKGAFRASGGRFSMTGKATAKSLSGSWRGPSCFGTFSIRT
jgi:hypothetical protein